MGPKSKVATIFLLFVILVLGLWQLTSPPTLPSVGGKYLNSPYASRGGWVLETTASHGRVYLAFSIANLTFPRPSLSTTYSLLVSKFNETLSDSYVKGVSMRVNGLTIEDNYDGSVSAWGKTNNFTDAVQATSLFFFRTSATHQLRITVSYQIYNILIFGYFPDHTETRSFNITQTVI